MTETPEKINDNISIYQNSRSLAFGTDAYLLSAYVRKGAKDVCELGAGSGVISLLMTARNKLKHSLCVEIQENISALCAKNIGENGMTEKIDSLCYDIRKMPAEYNEHFDTVVSNPPYMKATSGKLNDSDADSACRHEMHGTIDDFCKAAARILKYGGLFYAVYRPDRLAELMAACQNCGLAVKEATLVYPTTSHKPNIVLIKAKKGAADGMVVSKPLVMYKSTENMTDSGFTDEMKYIYDNGDFDESFR